MRIFRGVGAPAMKGVLLLFVVLAGLSATGQELSVSVWKHADADFGRYKSFDWAAHLDHVLDEHHFFLDDLVLKADVRFAIRNELQERGYELNRFAPDLLLNARVFERSGVTNTEHRYNARYWKDSEYNPVGEKSGTRVEAGTLIISIVDTKTKQIVWEARVAGLKIQDEFVKNEKIIRNAVNLVFDRYDIPEGTYTRR